jgi:hypothetical protein
VLFLRLFVIVEWVLLRLLEFLVMFSLNFVILLEDKPRFTLQMPSRRRHELKAVLLSAPNWF